MATLIFDHAYPKIFEWICTNMQKTVNSICLFLKYIQI